MKKIKQIAKYILPVPAKKALKYGYHSLLDLKDFITRARPAHIPPHRLNFVGSEDFLNVSNEFFGYFTDPQIGAVKPHHHILDIGSGVGRMAIPFLDYFSTEGGYQGFDIDQRGVRWCHNNLTKTHPHFQFQYVDLFNKYYNKKGALIPSEFSFPYESNRFDFAFATSVFTHLLTEDAEHYLEEISRVLKPGGRALVTFFVIDEFAQVQIEQKKSTCDLKYKLDEHSLYSHRNVPEAEIGYTLTWLQANLKKAGLHLNKIHYGSWSGRENPLSYQDVVLVRKVK